MKREKKTINHIKKFWNLMKWNRCNKCKKEFRREAGWRVDAFMIGFPYEIEVCRECCPTILDAETYFKILEDTHKKFKWKKKR